jgi:hypothetical protein
VRLAAASPVTFLTGAQTRLPGKPMLIITLPKNKMARKFLENFLAPQPG